MIGEPCLQIGGVPVKFKKEGPCCLRLAAVCASNDSEGGGVNSNSNNITCK